MMKYKVLLQCGNGHRSWAVSINTMAVQEKINNKMIICQYCESDVMYIVKELYEETKEEN